MCYLVNRTRKFGEMRTYRLVRRFDCEYTLVYGPPRWYGPFDTLQEAVEWARNTGDPVKLCPHCTGDS